MGSGRGEVEAKKAKLINVGQLGASGKLLVR